MSNVIAVVGPSGYGKTTSMLPNPFIKIIGLNPKETVWNSVAGMGKPLLFPGVNDHYKQGTLDSGANYIVQSDPFKVAIIIRRIAGGIDPVTKKVVEPKPEFNHIKNIVVDDAQYFQGFTFMDKVTEKG